VRNRTKRLLKVSSITLLAFLCVVLVVLSVSFEARLFLLRLFMEEEDAYSFLLRRDPENIRALKGRAKYYTLHGLLKKNLADRALADYNKVLKIKPGDIEALKGRISVYWAKQLMRRTSGLPTDASWQNMIIEDCTRLVELGKADYFTYSVRGLEYYDKSLYPQAIADLTACINLKPNNPHLFAYRSEVYFYNDEYEKAVQDMRKAHELNPDIYEESPEDWLGRWTSTYVAKRDLEKVLEAYTRMIKHNPNIADLYTLRAWNYIELGRYDEAIKDYTKAIDLSPNNPEVLARRGGLGYRINGEFEKALADCNNAIKLDPDASMPYYFRGCILFDMKKYDEAKNDLIKATELAPAWDEPYTKLGDLYMSINQPEKAIEYYDTAVNKGTHIGVFFLKAKAFETAGKIDEAIKAYKEYLKYEYKPYNYGWYKENMKYAKNRIKILEKP